MLCLEHDYPTSRLGCGFVDNFGQNFIIIFCVLGLLSAGQLNPGYRLVLRKQKSQDSKAPNGRRFFRSTTQIEKSMPQMLSSGLHRLGTSLLLQVHGCDSAISHLLQHAPIRYLLVHDSHWNISVLCSLLLRLLSLHNWDYFFLILKLWEQISSPDNEEIVDLGRTALKLPHWVRVFSFQFNGYSRIDALWKLLFPLVEYFRVLLICIFMIVL